MSLNKVKRFKFFFLILLITSWVFEVKLNIDGQREYIAIPRVLNIVFLGFYYFFSVKRTNTFFLFFLTSLLLVAVLFAKNNSNSLGMLSVSISRALLILMLLTYKEKLDGKLLKKILFICSIVIGVLIYILFKDTSFFYFSALATIFLIVLLAISFTKILTSGLRKGNLEFFCAMFVFLFSDAFFGSRKLIEPEITYVILSATSYLLAYLLITQSVIKYANKTISKN